MSSPEIYSIMPAIGCSLLVLSALLRVKAKGDKAAKKLVKVGLIFAIIFIGLGGIRWIV